MKVTPNSNGRDERVPGGGRVVNRKELAAFLGVVPSTINKWVDELGMPQLKAGTRGVPARFNTADCLWWRLEYVVRRASGSEGTDRSAPSSVALRKASANTIIAEEKARAALTEVVLVSDAVETFDARLARIGKRLEKIAAKAAPKVARETDPRKCQRLIAEAMNDLRRKIVEASATDIGRAER